MKTFFLRVTSTKPRNRKSFEALIEKVHHQYGVEDLEPTIIGNDDDVSLTGYLNATDAPDSNSSNGHNNPYKNLQLDVLFPVAPVVQKVIFDEKGAIHVSSFIEENLYEQMEEEFNIELRNKAVDIKSKARNLAV